MNRSLSLSLPSRAWRIRGGLGCPTLAGLAILCGLFGSVVAAQPPDRIAAVSVTPDADEDQRPVVMPPLADRFGGPGVEEVPDFQRHIGPLLGHLGCNGRACHGSFQGRGGFMLSLFGYDFATDHAALIDGDSGRIDLDEIAESLILFKPIDAERHEGGKRMDLDSWQYRVLSRWIEGGAEFSGEIQHLEALSVEPAELLFEGAQQQAQLKVVARWADGTLEEVTDLCRFTTNDDSVAKVSQSGEVTSGDIGDTHVIIAYDRAVVPVPVMRPGDLDPLDLPQPPSSDHPVDLLIAAKLDKMRIVPSDLCDDADFIRRVSFDLTGTLPPAERVERFLADDSPGKREVLIEELLTQPGYAAWWATRLSDWTGNNEAQLNNYLPIRGLATQLWFRWLEKRLSENVGYDEIMEGLVLAQSRMPDESYREYCETMSEVCRTGDTDSYAERSGMPIFWARNNFRTNEERAIGFAYTFLGVRIECAQCHKHPFDRWSKDDFDQFAVLFSPIRATPNSTAPESAREMRRMTEEITGGENLRGGDLRQKITEALKEGKVVPFPELTINAAPANRNRQNRGRPQPNRQGKILGESDQVVVQGDPREALMEWLRSPENPYFAKAIVNRVWANHFGIGIVNPVDDLNLGNPPSNAPLLDHLAQGFIESGFDLHWLHRHILTSHAYQRSSVPNASNVNDKQNFSRHVPRRLPAEALRDAIRLATFGAEEESRARAELSGLAISGVLNAERRGRGDFALQVFGQSTRESNCDCDRSDQSNLLQSLYLRNDLDIHQSLSQRGGWVEQATAAWEPAGASGRMEGRGSRERQQLIRRFQTFLDLPPQRQQQMRPRLVRELQQVNRRRTQNELEPLRFADLMRSARESLREAGAPTGDSEPSQVAAAAGARSATGTSVAAVPQSEIDAVVRAAYLRTLSRYPSADELTMAREYMQDSESPAAGLRSVLWALLNTKEFVLTH
ncbi:MAG: DUF1553 domain-containing protein [Planctomycetaceae bacterium]|nr:MAG: DUF1553 domain-containing protein [Planctomycetaceae bacterium]